MAMYYLVKINKKIKAGINFKDERINVSQKAVLQVVIHPKHDCFMSGPRDVLWAMLFDTFVERLAFVIETPNDSCKHAQPSMDVQGHLT